MASGDEGVFGAGRGDMRAVAETNGDAKEPDLLRKRKTNQIKSYKIEAQKIVTTISVAIQIGHEQFSTS